MIYLTIAALLGVIVIITILGILTHINHNKLLMSISVREYEREKEWSKERKELLDRIMSPTFAEYKHAEVKIIKAQNPEKVEEPITLL